MTYAEELAFKRQKVQDALQRIGGWEGEVTGIHGAKDPDRYRNKIQFPVAEGPKVGFFRARSHDVIDAPDCLLQPMAATRLRGAFRDWMAAHHIPAYDEKAHRGLLRHFYVRTNRKGQSLCAVIANGEALPQEAALVQALRQAEPNLVGVVLSVNREKTNVILGKTYRTLWGQDYLEDTLCGLEFRLSVPSFYQVNREQAEVLYGRALAFAGLTGRETVVDLYCGIGTITLVMARQAGRAIGAEVIPAAVEDAQANARRNGVENAEFLCADAGQAAQELARRGLRPDVICVDPPRKGISPEVVEAIVQMAPQRVVYVSCDPATLGRDVKRLREGGYQLQQAEAVDTERIRAFLATPLAQEIRQARQVWREYRFALLMPAALYDPAAEGEELMLQGVVDCAFRTKEGLVVVDFKTDRLAPGEEPQRAEEYRPQLEAYAQALERVMEEKVCRKVLYFFSTGATINL